MSKIEIKRHPERTFITFSGFGIECLTDGGKTSGFQLVDGALHCWVRGRGYIIMDDYFIKKYILNNPKLAQPA